MTSRFALIVPEKEETILFRCIAQPAIGLIEEVLVQCTVLQSIIVQFSLPKKLSQRPTKPFFLNHGRSTVLHITIQISWLIPDSLELISPYHRETPLKC